MAKKKKPVMKRAAKAKPVIVTITTLDEPHPEALAIVVPPIPAERAKRKSWWEWLLGLY